MAFVSSKPKNRSNNCHNVHDIVFDGALLSNTRAVLVCELLHYFLYERQQIPLPVDQLRLRTDIWTSESDHQEYNQSQDNAKRKASNCKAKSLLGDLKHLSDNLKRAFEACTELEQVAILLGGTVFNPKESILIKFPPPCPDADGVSLDTCKRTLFKQVISEDILGSLPTSVPLSNISVLLSAPRSLPLSWFLPRHSMKAPKTGTIVSINFHCTYLVPICHELTIEEGDINISGLEPLDCSQCEKETLEYSETSMRKPSRTSCNLSKSFSNGGEMEGEHTHIDLPNPDTTSQFCQHQKLSYILDSYDRNFKKVITSPHGRTPSASSYKSYAVSGSPFCESHSSEKLYSQSWASHFQAGASKSIEMSEDCIWYQSPITLKGFKDLFRLGIAATESPLHFKEQYPSWLSALAVLPKPLEHKCSEVSS